MNPYLTGLKSTYEKHASPHLAIRMSAYMKNKFQFYGIQKPLRAEISKPFFESLKNLSMSEMENVVRWLWKQPQREFVYFALELLYKNKKAWTTDCIELFEELIVDKSWWDTIDYISPTLIGHYFKTWKKDKINKAMEWSKSDNLWLIRAALLFQLKYKTETDEMLLYRLINMHKGSDEFFIRKAIGTALRRYAITNKKSVLNFVDNTNLKPLSKREALKHL